MRPRTPPPQAARSITPRGGGRSITPPPVRQQPAAGLDPKTPRTQAKAAVVSHAASTSIEATFGVPTYNGRGLYQEGKHAYNLEGCAGADVRALAPSRKLKSSEHAAARSVDFISHNFHGERLDYGHQQHFEGFAGVTGFVRDHAPRKKKEIETPINRSVIPTVVFNHDIANSGTMKQVADKIEESGCAGRSAWKEPPECKGLMPGAAHSMSVLGSTIFGLDGHTGERAPIHEQPAFSSAAGQPTLHAKSGRLDLKLEAGGEGTFRGGHGNNASKQSEWQPEPVRTRKLIPELWASQIDNVVFNRYDREHRGEVPLMHGKAKVHNNPQYDKAARTGIVPQLLEPHNAHRQPVMQETLKPSGYDRTLNPHFGGVPEYTL